MKRRIWPRRRRQDNWHSWYAWRPVFVGHESGYYFVWLERVLRREVQCGSTWRWQYRLSEASIGVGAGQLKVFLSWVWCWLPPIAVLVVFAYAFAQIVVYWADL